MVQSRVCSIAVAAVGILASALSHAQMLKDQGPPQHRIVHRNMFAIRANPIGLLWEGRFAYRLRLYESDKLALRDNFIALGLAPATTPAYIRGGPTLEIQPLTILNLWALFEGVRQFGTFGSLQSFPTVTANYSDGERSRLADLPDADPRRSYAATATQLTLGANLLFKIGPMFVRDTTRLIRPSADLRAGDRAFYDTTYDNLAPNRGWYMVEDLDVAWRGLDEKLIIGARYTGNYNFYTSSHYAPGEKQSHGNDSHRVGPIVAYTFFSRDGAAFNTPTVFLIAQWWVAHRYRSGQEVSAALPMIAAGFQFTGDFLPVDAPATTPAVTPPPETPPPKEEEPASDASQR